MTYELKGPIPLLRSPHHMAEESSEREELQLMLEALNHAYYETQHGLGRAERQLSELQEGSDEYEGVQENLAQITFRCDALRAEIEVVEEMLLEISGPRSKSANKI